MRSHPPVNVAFDHGSDGALDVEVLRFDEGFPSRPADHSPFEPHRPRFHVVVLYDAGRGFHEVDFRRHACAAGSMVFVGPGQVHCFERDSTLRGHVLVFTQAALLSSRLLGTAEGLDPFNHHALEASLRLDAHALPVFARLVEDVRSVLRGPADDAQTPLLHHLLGMWLIRCRRVAPVVGRGASARERALFQRFTDLTEKHRGHTRNASDYAKWLDVSPQTLGRITRAVSGRTPKALIDEDLVLEVKRRLAQGDRSVSDIAEELGFADTTDLAKFFKRKTNTTPGAFLRKRQDRPTTARDRP